MFLLCICIFSSPNQVGVAVVPGSQGNICSWTFQELNGSGVGMLMSSSQR